VKEKLQQAGIIEREARSRGATLVEVLVVESDRRTVDSKDRSVKNDTEQSAHLRVYLDEGRVGLATARSLKDRSVHAAIDRALAKARGAKPDPHAGPPPRLDTPSRGLGVLDSRYPTIDDEARLETIEWNVESCAGVDRGVVVERFLYEEVLHSRTFVATGGRTAFEQSTRYRLTGDAHHKKAPEVSFTETNASRNFAEVASQPLGVVLGRRVLRTQTRAALPTERRPVVLSQVVVAELLPRILRAARAERLDKGHSFVQRHAGHKIASAELHVVDDARLPGGYATRAFDDRGVPSVPITVLREGVLGGAYQGPESARGAHVDARPSGHETFDGGLWLGNLVVRPGNRSRNMLFPDLGVITEIEALAAPPVVDPQSDRVSLKAHVWVLDAKEEHGYAGIHTLTCAVPDLLGAVIHVCSDHERHGIVDTPTWILDGVWFDD
jgi:predicted Zn-dependent protease